MAQDGRMLMSQRYAEPAMQKLQVYEVTNQYNNTTCLADYVKIYGNDTCARNPIVIPMSQPYSPSDQMPFL